MMTLLRRLGHSITVNMLGAIAGLGRNEPFDSEPPFATVVVTYQQLAT